MMFSFSAIIQEAKSVQFSSLIYCKLHAFYQILHVRLIGLEPTRITTPDPKSGASTNFATSAKDEAKLVQTGRNSKFQRENVMKKFFFGS